MLCMIARRLIAQSVILLACWLSSCQSLPKDYHKQQNFPAPPVLGTESPDELFDEFLNQLLHNIGEQDYWYFDNTAEPAPEIPELPVPHEEVAELPKYFPTFNPMTAMPTLLIDTNYYNSTVTSSSFIAVAIAIVVILIISIVVTIYAIKARKRGIIIMTIRRSFQRNGELLSSVTDSDRSLLVRPAPIVYVEDGRIRTAPSTGPEPPPYTEHHESLLLPSELPPPYTEALGDRSENLEESCDAPQSADRERSEEV